MVHIASVAAVALIFCASGCLFSLDDSVIIAESPDQDEKYSEAFTRATRSEEVVSNFETKYKVTATFVSPDFRNAFFDREKTIYLHERPTFGQVDGKTIFIVSMFVPDSKLENLANPNHWTVLLHTNEGTHKPSQISKINDKERYRAFHSGVNQWSVEYLLFFDTPAANPGTPDLVEKSPIQLKFANADGQVLLTW